jgi:hypothetical protein
MVHAVPSKRGTMTPVMVHMMSIGQMLFPSGMGAE